MSATDDLRREINEVKQGFCYVAGTCELSTSSTSTVISRRGVSTTSVISLTPYDPGARTEGIPQCVPATDTFRLTHTSTATARTYRYVVHTPQ